LGKSAVFPAIPLIIQNSVCLALITAGSSQNFFRL
jgi:hypothetical protein